MGQDVMWGIPLVVDSSSPVPGLFVRLRASSMGSQADGSLAAATWLDESGFGRNATRQNSSIYYEKEETPRKTDALRFDSAGGSWYDLAIPMLSAMTEATVFVVLKSDAAHGAQNQGPWKFGGGDISFYPYSDYNVYDGAFSTSRGSFAIDDPQAWHVLCVSSKASEWRAYLDDVLKASAAFTFSNGGGGAYIGRYNTAWHGKIAELVIYNRVLTAAERTIVHDYLRRTHIQLPSAADDYAAQVLADSPLAYWKFDETGPDASDSSGNGVHLTQFDPLLGQMVTPFRGKTTCGFSNFSYWDAGNIFARGGQPISVECFFRLNKTWPGGTNGQNSPLITKGTSWQLRRIGGTDSLGFVLGGSSPVATVEYSGESWQGGHWHHVVATYDGSNLRLYKNGTLRATTPYAGGIPAGDAGTFRIAHWSLQTSRNFSPGYMAHAAIYPTALSAARVAAHFAAA